MAKKKRIQKSRPWFTSGYRWERIPNNHSPQGQLVYWGYMVIGLVMVGVATAYYGADGIVKIMPYLLLLSSIYFYITVKKGTRLVFHWGLTPVKNKHNKRLKPFYLLYLAVLLLLVFPLISKTGLFDYCLYVTTAIIYAYTIFVVAK